MVFLLVALLSLICFGFFGLLALFVRQVTYWRLKGIPYVYSSPIFGFIGPVFFRTKSFPEMAQECYNASPGVRYFGSVELNTLVLVIKDPDLVKEIGVKSFEHFPNHRSFVEDDFDPLLSKNIFSLKDNRWREMRMTLSPTFTASKMKYMFQLISNCAEDFAKYLTDNPQVTREMDLKDVYKRYTNDVIASVAFGVSVDSMRDRDNEFYIRGREATDFNGFWKNLKFLMARICPNLMRRTGLRFLSAKSNDFFKSLVNETLRVRKDHGIVRPDMINLLMQAAENKNGIEMTSDDIIAQSFIFFLAGFDTSSRLMCFVSHVLSHHPEIQERLRKEVDAILDESSESVTYETVSRMEYMDMVVLETLRLYPPTPITDRLCAKPYNLPGPVFESKKSLTVEPDTIMWIPIYGFHHDPNYFPDPETFNPERFSSNNKANVKPYTFMPFGLGPRKCIGERFAVMETKILIAHLLRRFEFLPSKKTTKEVKFAKNCFTVEPENGFWLTFKPRNN